MGTSCYLPTGELRLIGVFYLSACDTRKLVHGLVPFICWCGPDAGDGPLCTVIYGCRLPSKMQAGVSKDSPGSRPPPTCPGICIPPPTNPLPSHTKDNGGCGTSTVPALTLVTSTTPHTEKTAALERKGGDYRSPLVDQWPGRGAHTKYLIKFKLLAMAARRRRDARLNMNK
eukprot:scaffold124701_cov28-Tisochrysis_lutea.AAC.5